MSRRAALLELAGPLGLLVILGLLGSLGSETTQQNVITVLIMATAVIGTYVFVGLSGVISFGHVSFVAIGAFAGGLLSIPAETKPFVMHDLFPFLAHHSISSTASLALAAGVGALYALIIGLPLMRLSGLAAGIATFAVLEITHNVLRNWTKIGPGPQTLSLVPETVGLREATIGAALAALVAWGYGRSGSGRRLRAAREDGPAAEAIGVDIVRERFTAFVVSGAIAGLAGGLLVHQLGSVTTEQVYRELTFLTLAMLVVGGLHSLWGATVGAVLIAFLNIYLGQAENGLDLGVGTVSIPDGSSLIVLGVLMAAVVILRPEGITGGRELSTLRWPRRRRRRPSAGLAEPGVADS
jgi:branched-chain amino acid transport system permease protein